MPQPTDAERAALTGALADRSDQLAGLLRTARSKGDGDTARLATALLNVMVVTHRWTAAWLADPLYGLAFAPDDAGLEILDALSAGLTGKTLTS